MRRLPILLVPLVILGLAGCPQKAHGPVGHARPQMAVVEWLSAVDGGDFDRAAALAPPDVPEAKRKILVETLAERFSGVHRVNDAPFALSPPQEGKISRPGDPRLPGAGQGRPGADPPEDRRQVVRAPAAAAHAAGARGEEDQGGPGPGAQGRVRVARADPEPASLRPVRFPVRVKLALFVAGVVLLAGGVPAGWLVLHARAQASARIHAQLFRLGATIAGGGLFVDGQGGVDGGALRDFVDNAPALRLPLVYVVFVGPEGRPDPARSAVNAKALAPVAPALAARWRAGDHPAVLAALATGSPGPDAAALGVRLKSKAGATLGHLQIGMSTVEADRRARATLRQSAGIVGALLLGALLLAISLAGPLVRPLSRLAKAMAAVTEGDLDQTVLIRTRDEVGRLGETFNDMVAGLRQRERLRATLGRYVSDEVASRILSEADDLDVHGETRTVTVLFLDMRGFSSLTEHMAPREVLELINAYFDIIIDCVTEAQGMVNKFIGDAVMAVWGAPRPIADPELKAIRCAYAIQKRLGAHNWQRLQSGLPVVNVGIGINTGTAVAGNVGTERRLEYTVLGHEVNMAQRLESIAQPGQILVSARTFEAVRGRVTAQPLDPVRVKGKQEPVVPFEITGLEDGADAEAG